MMDIEPNDVRMEPGYDRTAVPLRGLVDWLTSKPVVRPAETGSGVVNFLAPDGTWDGLYPEICGYYLQFAAHAAAVGAPGDEPRLREAAAAVAAWLDAVGGAQAEPLTLYHRNMAESDWRNKCLFAFDMAIILRGFAVAESRWPGLVPRGAFERYALSLRRIVRDGRLDSYLLRPGSLLEQDDFTRAHPSCSNPLSDRVIQTFGDPASGHHALAEIPVKWSTTQGVLHVKAAAALRGLGRADFKPIAEATLRDEAQLFAAEGEARMRELHPFLYSIEGWLMLWGQTQAPDALANARRSFRMVLGQMDAVTGELPPVANMRDAPVRSDVLAQALRAGVVLEAAGQMTGDMDELWQMRRPALETTLFSRLSPEGGVLFDFVGMHRNSWASMFAWQALAFLRSMEANTLDPVAAAVALI